MKHLITEFAEFGKIKPVLLKAPKLVAMLPQDVIYLHDLFKSNGFQLVVVGGAVRDFLMNQTPNDYDLATNATPFDILEMVQGMDNITTSDVGISNGVVFLYLDGEEFEIATFRKDSGSSRKSNTVTFVKTILEDYPRRDLTSNALYLDIGSKNIIDYVGGIEDIKSGTIKTVGEALLRFSQDKSRKLRAIRFAAKTDSKLSKDVWNALDKDNSLEGMSMESKMKEFKKGIKQSKSIWMYLNMLSEHNILQQILPNVDISYYLRELNTLTNPIAVITFLISENNFDVIGSDYLMKTLKMTKSEAKLSMYLLKSIHKDFEYMLKHMKDVKLTKDLAPLLEQFYTHSQVKILMKFDIKAEKGIITKELIKQGVKGKELGQAINTKLLQTFTDKMK